mgnify:FL=1
MIDTIHNWSRTHACNPTKLAFPEDEAAVIALVTEAAATGATLRVVGVLHFWSDIAMSDGVLVSLDRMQRVLELDAAGLRVRVQAGIRVKQLNEALAAAGLALPIVGSVVEQSVAGVLATGTHGSSLVHGNIADSVVGMRLVTGQGDVVELQDDDPRLPAARVALGALGVVTEVTLRVVSAFQLCETTEAVSFDDAVRDMAEIARSAEYVKLWWLPHTDVVIIFRAARTTDLGRISPIARWLDEHLLNRLVFAAVLRLGRLFRGLIAPLNRLIARTYLKPRRTIGRSDRVLSLAMPPRHRETEYALALADAGAALAATRALILNHDLRVNFITEVRFVRGDDAWMSPASGRDTCQLGAYMGDAAGVERYFSEFETAMKALGGRPHWGKSFRVTTDELRAIYPDFQRFRDLVETWDPQRIFRNRFVARLFEDPTSDQSRRDDLV